MWFHLVYIGYTPRSRIARSYDRYDIQQTKIMTSGPITSWQIDGETVETVSDFILGGGVQNHCRW